MSLTRPQAGQPLSNPSGPAVMDEYADAIEQSQADILAAQADIIALEAGGGGGGSTHVVYSDDYPDVAAVALHSCDSLNDATGQWFASGTKVVGGIPTPLTIDTVNKSPSTSQGSVSTILNFPGGSGTDGKMYCNLANPVSTTGHQEMSIELRWSKDGTPTTAFNFEVAFASADGLTGTVVTRGIGGTADLWQTISVPVGALTQIKSFGVRKEVLSSSGGGANVNAIFKIDSPFAKATSALDAAFATDNRAVVVSPNFLETVPQGVRVLSPTQSLHDLRQTDSNQTNFRSVHSFRDRLLDETGATDMTAAVQAFFDSLLPGDLLTAPPGATYRVDGHIELRNPGVTIDMQEASFFSTAALPASVGIPSMFSITADYVTLLNWRIFNKGMPNQTYNGSTLTNTAGAPVTVGTTKELRVIPDEVRVPLFAGGNDTNMTPRYARDEDGYIQFDLTLSQAAPGVASDAVVSILPHTPIVENGANVLDYQTTIPSIATTPTVYPIKFKPTDLIARTQLRVKKTKAGSPIVVHSITGYRRVQYRVSGNATLDFTQNAGIVVGANYTTIKNYVGEGMGGDSIQCRAGTGLRVDGWIARATGRENLVVTHGHDCEIRNFLMCGGARDTIDIEPETGDNVNIDNFRLINGVIGSSWNVAVATSGGDRINNVLFENILMRVDIGGVWQGPGTGMKNYTLRNVTYVNERTDGALGDFDFNGENLTIENLISDGSVTIDATNTTVRGMWLKNIVQTGTLVVNGAGCDLEDVRIGDPDRPFTLDTNTVSFNPVILQPDTTYRNLDVPVWKAEFGNTFKANIATQLDWLPRGMDLDQSGVRQVRGLSATTTPANNLRGLAQAVTTAATTATVAFPARTDVMQLPATSLAASGPHATKLTAQDSTTSGSWYAAYNGQDTRKTVSGATYVLGTPWQSGDVGTSGDHPFPRGIVTFTVPGGHDLLVGDRVGVSGMTNDVYNSKHMDYNADKWGYVVLTIPTSTTFTSAFTWADPGSAGGSGVLGFAMDVSNAHVQRWMRALSTLSDTDVTVTGNGLTVPGGSGGLTLTWGASLGDTPSTLFSATSIDLMNSKGNIQVVAVQTSVIGGFVVSNQWYVYRTAGRSFEGQPLAGRAAAKIFLSAGANSVGIGTGGGNLLYSQGSDMAVAGFTVWRAGPFPSDPLTYTGTYTKRADFVGTSDFNHPTGTTDRETSIGGVSWTTVNVTSAELDTNQSGWEADANYGVWITPNWLTTYRVSAKRTGGFDVQFGTAAPALATFDWGLIR